MEHATSQVRPPQDRPAQVPAPDPRALRRALQDRVNQADWHGALACWAAVEDADAAEASSYVCAALALRRLGRAADAEALIEAGLAAYPEFPQLALDHAWVAVEAHGWAAALDRWRAAYAAFPDNTSAAVSLARCLRETGDYAAAEAHVDAALRTLGAAAPVWMEWAEIAHQRRDWQEAVARWQRLRQQFPATAAITARLATALREAGRPAECEAVCLEAIARGDAAPALLTEHAINAHTRGDWAQAVQRWAVLRAQAPDALIGYGWGAMALHHFGRGAEAEEVLAEAARRFPGRSDVPITAAQLLQERGDWSGALRRWGEVKEKHPDLPQGYLGASQALRHLDRVAEAEVILAPALRLFPESFSILAEHAANGSRRGDADESLRRWDAVRQRFPDHPAGYLGAAAACRQAGRLAEAERMLEQAVARFAQDYALAADYAAIAAYRGAPAEAVERWRRVTERFPGRVAAWVSLAAALRDSGDLDAAEAVAQAAHARLGQDCDLGMLLAEIAAKRGDADEAVRRWDALRAAFPTSRVFAGSVAALRQLGRLDAAERLLAEALPRFADDLELQRQQALTVSERRDWPAALPLWEKLKRRAPANPAVLGALQDILWHARIDQGAGMVGPAEHAMPPFEIPAILLSDGPSGEDTEQLQRLMMQFESLGDTCEFGIVQRRFGAEPLGLLRWAAISPANLLAALQARFAGMGEPEQTTLRVSNGEYVSIDTRYDTFSHTFTNEGQVPRDRFYIQLCKRVAFLRRILVETIERGDKILVYKHDPAFSTDMLRDLHAAVIAYNPRTALLGVRLADAEHPSGNVEMLRDGLYAGYIDRFSNVDISVDAWISLCRQALQLRGAAD